MNKTIFTITFLFLLSFSLISAATFTPDKTLSKAYTVTNVVNPEGGRLVYEIDAPEYTMLNFVLSGEGAYKPQLSLYNPETDDYLVRELEPNVGSTVELTYIMSDTQYYAIINNAGSTGSSYTFTYTPIAQNDAGLGGDATKRFRDAETITLGEYAGDLGDEDEMDYYALNLVRDEELTIEVTATEKGYLGIQLIDGSLFTKIDNGQRLVKGASLTAKYNSLKEQTAYIGVSGDVAYELSLSSDVTRDTTIDEVVTDVADVADAMDEVTALSDAERAMADLEGAVADAQQEIERQERKSKAWLWLFILLVLGAGGFVYWKFFMKEQPKKSSKKKNNKKK